ncbi:MAG TPA: DUF3488 and transglutaminase-like domain-containing protein [Pilimelia sp.]|nr:DUF3488 and transglutaminase-like domain-containing protein [Pilimelia sp.]
MSAPRRLSAVAGAATALAAAPLGSLFGGWAWLRHVLVVVVAVAAASAAAGRLRAPWWARTPLLLAACTVAWTVLFPSGGELLRVIPTAGTLRHFRALAGEAPAAVQNHAVPAPDAAPLLFLVAAGVGLIAVLVDLAVVAARRPALAGLPMLAVYAVPVAILADGAPVLPFALGAVGFLWLLVADSLVRVRQFGRRFSGDGRAIESWAPSPLSAAARRLGVVGVALAAALPLAFPTFEASALQPGGAGVGAGRGQGRAVDVLADLSGRLTQPDMQEMVHVTTSDPKPQYLRFAVADVVDENGFRAAGWSGDPITAALGEVRSVTGGGTVHRARIRTTDNFTMRMLPVYPELLWSDIGAGWLLDRQRGTVFSAVHRGADRTYEIGYRRPEYTARQLQRVPDVPADDPAMQWTQVPDVPRIRELVAGLTRGATNQFDKVDRLRRHFAPANGFRYDVRTEPGSTGAAITDFLERKVGFCQQYAAALAWLARAAGVPARVAIGFTLGSDNRGGARVLTNRNLHAWTEIYFSGLGWLLFDATPPASVVGGLSPQYPPAREPDTDGGDTAGSDSTDQPDEPAPSSSAEAPQAPARDVDAGAPGAAAAPPGAGSPRWRWAGAAPLLLLLAALPALRRRQLRRRRHHLMTGRSDTATATDGPAPAGGEPWRGRAHAAWAELTDTLVDYRVAVPANETPRQRMRRLSAEWGLAGDAAARVAQLALAEERARYARTPGAACELAGALAEVRRACGAGATRGERWAAEVLPASVLAATRDGARARAEQWGEAYRRRHAAAVTRLAQLRPGRLPH